MLTFSASRLNWVIVGHWDPLHTLVLAPKIIQARPHLIPLLHHSVNSVWALRRLQQVFLKHRPLQTGQIPRPMAPTPAHVLGKPYTSRHQQISMFWKRPSCRFEVKPSKGYSFQHWNVICRLVQVVIAKGRQRGEEM